MNRIPLITGFVLMAMAKLNPVISGPYTRNIERHQAFDDLCFTAGLVLFLAGLAWTLFRRR